MDMGIRGRHALVFGGSRGMGRAIARSLALEGVAVTIAARNPQTLAATAAELSAETGNAVAWVAADIGSEAGRSAALAACPAPDILINNADGPAPGDFHDWSREDWIKAFDAMMLGPILMMRATVDGMIARKFGRIVNISSRSVKTPQAELGLSNGARSGLVGFVAGLARQTVRHNVTINNLLPGPFDTDRLNSVFALQARETGTTVAALRAERMKANPAGRFGDPAEFGDACAYLCSAQAGFITGQNILLDGGVFPGTF